MYKVGEAIGLTPLWGQDIFEVCFEFILQFPSMIFHLKYISNHFLFWTEWIVHTL